MQCPRLVNILAFQIHLKLRFQINFAQFFNYLANYELELKLNEPQPKDTHRTQLEKVYTHSLQEILYVL